MSRRRSSSRAGLPTWLLAVVVILLGGAVLSSAGWVPVFLAVGAALALAALTSRRGRRTRRRKSR